ncbi:hypothetical protein JCM19302_2432 [Jejuia pallidilutea]|uniref:Uncharacterized protein n=1 Tax=Jejuia pallidilutea TaxID=504487 RepID=A0A090W112_9FLAO|nr:hypothetical protein JCM19302_2432 [Jejuia pallidilutea]GAL90585.1 hypothetical protein JCM19538_350 [Jejuia pallidilutea]
MKSTKNKLIMYTSLKRLKNYDLSKKKAFNLLNPKNLGFIY